MKVYINDAGELTCEMPLAQSTVAELIAAVEHFCLASINCSICMSTCCAGFIVYADNVFIRNYASMTLQTMGELDTVDAVLRAISLDGKTMKWFVPQKADGKCHFLSYTGRCLIYNIRPLVCRMHVCRPNEPHYKLIKDLLYFAYQEALTYEMINLLSTTKSPEPEYWTRVNPLLGANTYDANILETVAWSQASWRSMIP